MAGEVQANNRGNQMAVNQERVNVVCNELAEAGKKATLAAVREALGEGSFSTIGPMVQAWKAGRGDVVAGGATGAGAIVVPDAIQAVGGKLMAEVWAMAERMAAERLATERAAMEAARAEMAGELAQAYAEMDALREEVAKVSGQMLEIIKSENRLSECVKHMEKAENELRTEAAIAKAEANAYKLAIEKINPQVNQEHPKKPVLSKKTGKAIGKSNAEPADTKTAPLGL